LCNASSSVMEKTRKLESAGLEQAQLDHPM
jgi:predicted Ser/Thr protein kinase